MLLAAGVEQGVELYSPYRGLEERDLAISIQASTSSGPQMTEMGVICRYQGEFDFIAGVLRGDGHVSLFRKSGGMVERWVDWTSVAGLPGDASKTHTLQLTCASGEIRFTVDGTEVATAEDPSPAAGNVALLGGLLEPGRAVIAFDDLVVNAP